MRRRNWKLTFGVLIVLAIAIWDVGLPGHHGGSSASTGSIAASPGPVVVPTQSESTAPAIPGVIQIKGTPDWSATFTGKTLDRSVWSTCYPFYDQDSCQNFGNSTKEGQWYLPSQDQVHDGLLHLVAERKTTQGTTANGAPKTYACRSGMVTSYPGFNFEYGYIQIVASIPTASGLWPALWLAATNLKWPPEMDIVEAWGPNYHYHQFFAGAYFHYSGLSGQPTGSHKDISPASTAMGWHTFALSWTKTQLTWLVDGKAVYTVHEHIPHQKMYFIANLADAVNPKDPVVPTGDCNGSLLIKSVQYWKE